MVDRSTESWLDSDMEATTTARKIHTCPTCGDDAYRSSTPTVDETGRKTFLRHVETGFTACAR